MGPPCLQEKELFLCMGPPLHGLKKRAATKITASPIRHAKRNPLCLLHSTARGLYIETTEAWDRLRKKGPNSLDGKAGAGMAVMNTSSGNYCIGGKDCCGKEPLNEALKEEDVIERLGEVGEGPPSKAASKGMSDGNCHKNRSRSRCPGMGPFTVWACPMGQTLL